MRKNYAKDCHCHTCGRSFNYLGIAKHRAMHREKRELCKITYTHGDTYIHDYRKYDTRKIRFRVTEKQGSPTSSTANPAKG